MGRFHCPRCQRSASSRECLAGIPCEGQSSTHALLSAGQFLFCRLCGAYTAAKVVNLASICVGRPSSSSAADRRNRLLKGLHPISREFMGQPLEVEVVGGAAAAAGRPAAGEAARPLQEAASIFPVALGGCAPFLHEWLSAFAGQAAKRP